MGVLSSDGLLIIKGFLPRVRVAVRAGAHQVMGVWRGKTAIVRTCGTLFNNLFGKKSLLGQLCHFAPPLINKVEGVPKVGASGENGAGPARGVETGLKGPERRETSPSKGMGEAQTFEG